jgi:hypothetical protein
MKPRPRGRRFRFIGVAGIGNFIVLSGATTSRSIKSCYDFINLCFVSWWEVRIIECFNCIGNDRFGKHTQIFFLDFKFGHIL